MHHLVLQLEKIILKQKEATGEFSQPRYGSHLYVKMGTVPIQYLFCFIPRVA